MAGLLDVSRLTSEQRYKLALRIQVAQDFTLPQLKYWNYDSCRVHQAGWVETYFDQDKKEFLQRLVMDRPKPGCQVCGVHFRKHQRVGISWAYVKGRCGIFDVVGSGKSAHAAGLIAILKEIGEIDRRGKVLICPRPAALMQWEKQLNRMIPLINVASVITPTGSVMARPARILKYVQPWDVLLLGPQVLHNDYDLLTGHFEFSTLITDDVDALRHRGTNAAYDLKRFGRNCDRMVIMTGTPLQKKLQEMHSLLDPLGGIEVFGSESRFLQRYTQRKKVKLWNPKVGKSYTKIEIIGHRNVPEFIEKMAPMVLRRTFSDITDSSLPIIMPPNIIPLELHPAQREKYKALKKGVLEIIKREGDRLTQAKAQASVHSAAMICGGLSVLGEEDGIGTSSKLDWVMEKIVDGDLSDEKVVIFMRYKNGVRSLQARLDAVGIGYGTIWGEEPNKAVRAAVQDRFWTDPACRILIGTEAIEQSLNFQCARHLIYFDLIANPGRMEQLVGRIRRDGSEFPHVYVYYLICNDTHETRLLPKLEAEQALVSNVWDEKSELFAALSPLQIMQLIAES